MMELLRRRDVENNHRAFLDDFDEWLRVNYRDNPPSPV